MIGYNLFIFIIIVFVLLTCFSINCQRISTQFVLVLGKCLLGDRAEREPCPWEVPFRRWVWLVIENSEWVYTLESGRFISIFLKLQCSGVFEFVIVTSSELRI